MRPRGIEPRFHPSEGCILSVELRAQVTLTPVESRRSFGGRDPDPAGVGATGAFSNLNVPVFGYFLNKGASANYEIIEFIENCGNENDVKQYKKYPRGPLRLEELSP